MQICLIALFGSSRCFDGMPNFAQKSISYPSNMEAWKSLYVAGDRRYCHYSAEFCASRFLLADPLPLRVGNKNDRETLRYLRLLDAGYSSIDVLVCHIDLLLELSQLIVLKYQPPVAVTDRIRRPVIRTRSFFVFPRGKCYRPLILGSHHAPG